MVKPLPSIAASLPVLDRDPVVRDQDRDPYPILASRLKRYTTHEGAYLDAASSPSPKGLG
nr:hypothetical protein Q903MT_gene4392 [Picea sitchensis]